LDDNGNVWTFGRNYRGELGQGLDCTDSPEPMTAKLQNPVQQIACGYHHVLALESPDTVWAWGFANRGQLGLGAYNLEIEPKKIPDLQEITHVYCGGYYSIVQNIYGSYFCFGENCLGSEIFTRPHEEPSLYGMTLILGGFHLYAVNKDGEVFHCGASPHGVRNYLQHKELKKIDGLYAKVDSHMVRVKSARN
jgi:alpha-tubulin suppressor-like RCC1 family protein